MVTVSYLSVDIIDKLRAEGIILCDICMDTELLRDYKGHTLCVRCSLLGCGNCWNACLEEKDSWFNLRSRWVCPECGWKGSWRR